MNSDQKMAAIIKDGIKNGFRDELAKMEVLADLQYHYRRARDETIDAWSGIGAHPVPRTLGQVEAVHLDVLRDYKAFQGVEALANLFALVSGASIKTVN